jgi:hypothetical protein
MPDMYAVATALAARFAAAQVTPPAGYQNIRKATAAPPNAMPVRPCVIVFPEDGEFRTGNGTRMGGSEWLVRFYFNETGDIARDQVALLKWLTVLVDQLKLSVQLGGTVTTARVDGYKIGVMGYGRKDYSGIELRVHIVTTEPWAAVA